MIKFFRKIRQNLVAERKTMNYLKYAIGEVLLMVIGILIALQVNNWNKYKKDKEDERIALTEIYQSLHFELDKVIPHQLERVKMAEKGIDEFLNLREQHIAISDSVFEKLWNEINMGARFTYEAGSFETVKNRGLELISNDSLRTALVTLYETTFPRSQYFVNSYLDSQDYGVQATNLQTFLLKSVAYKNAQGNWAFKKVFKSSEMIYSDEFLELLNLKKDGSVYFRNSITPINLDIKNAINSIASELKTFDHD